MFKNKGLHNTYVSNKQSFLSFFNIAIFDLFNSDHDPVAYIRKNYWGGWNRAIKSCTYCDGISRKPRKYIRNFSPKTDGLQKKKKRSSSKFSHILRPQSEILALFLPKIRCSPKKKKKKKKKGLHRNLVTFFGRNRKFWRSFCQKLGDLQKKKKGLHRYWFWFFGHNFTLRQFYEFCRVRKTILTILQGTINYWGGWSINYWGGWLGMHPPSKIIGGMHPPHPTRDLRPCYDLQQTKNFYQAKMNWWHFNL